MKSAIFSLLVLFTATQAHASLHCTSDGSFRGIKEMTLTENISAGSVSVVTAVESVRGLDTVVSQSSGSLSSKSIILFQNFQMGIGTTRYSLVKTESAYEIVESIQCDSINGEERCPVADDEFSVQSHSMPVVCTQN